jgi:hypothetical protein
MTTPLGGTINASAETFCKCVRRGITPRNCAGRLRGNARRN